MEEDVVFKAEQKPQAQVATLRDVVEDAQKRVQEQPEWIKRLWEQDKYIWGVA